VDLVALCKALGVERVQRVDPYRLDEVSAALKDALAHEGPSVIVTGRPCVLIEAFQRPQAFAVQDQECNGCGACLRTGCPAIRVLRRETVPLAGGRERQLRYVHIDPAACNGCGICAEVCGPGAIVPLGAPAPGGGVEA
jgi:indolepyruvate ferredoxin oxidoreductase alpha subunit